MSNILSSNTMVIVDVFEYEGSVRRMMSKDPYGNVLRYCEDLSVEEDNMVSYKIYDSNDNEIAFVENTYLNNNMKTIIGVDAGGNRVSSYYEYNTICRF